MLIVNIPLTNIIKIHEYINTLLKRRLLFAIEYTTEEVVIKVIKN